MCTTAACIILTKMMIDTFSFPFQQQNTAWYDSEEARKVKNKEQNQEVKDMYTTERKEAMHSQVAELHQQKSSVSKTEQYSESKSSSEQIITSSSTSQQQETSQQQQITTETIIYIFC